MQCLSVVRSPPAPLKKGVKLETKKRKRKQKPAFVIDPFVSSQG
jgi:hypothetical protein